MESKYLQFAKKIVLKNSPLFLQHFGKAKSANKNQNPRDWVTDIDKAIEAEITGAIKREFPAHQVIGEEYFTQTSGQSGFVWVIDPIDGTSNYIRGLPFCCISLGLWKNNRPILGVVLNPALKQLFWAEKGKGAYLNGKPIKVSNTQSEKMIFAGFGWGRNEKKALKYFPKAVGTLNKIRVLGSTAYEICLVAMGVYDCRVDLEAKFWDFAAAAAIVSEAGGKVTQTNGKAIEAGSTSIVSANKNIHGQIVKLFLK